MSTEDYRRSRAGRRQAWYGLKKHVKRFLSLRIPHATMRATLRLAPGLRSGRLPAPARLREVRGTAQGAEFVMLAPDRCEIAKELYWGGGRRPAPADDLAVQLFARLAERSDVALDIGAYTGLFTLVSLAANPALTAHAFEVVPEVFRALFDNCVRNDLLHRATLHHIGVGAPDRLTRFPAASGRSALPSFYSTRLSFESGVLIRFESLDSLARLLEPGSRVIVKIDVEGTENEILEHGQGFLERFRPEIVCEVLADVADPARLMDLLRPHGYDLYLIRDSGLTREPTIEPHHRFRDWFFTQRPPDDPLLTSGEAVLARGGS